MENVKTLKTYNLVNNERRALQMRLGKANAENPYVNEDLLLRWSFIGTKIPMPVRSGTWFKGFPEHTMIEWLNENGWYLETKIDMLTGKATVYDLPDLEDEIIIEPMSLDDFSYEDIFKKARELRTSLGFGSGESILHQAIRELVAKGEKIDAIRLYRYVHCCRLREAQKAVEEIVDSNN